MRGRIERLPHQIWKPNIKSLKDYEPLYSILPIDFELKDHVLINHLPLWCWCWPWMVCLVLNFLILLRIFCYVSLAVSLLVAFICWVVSRLPCDLPIWCTTIPNRKRPKKKNNKNSTGKDRLVGYCGSTMVPLQSQSKVINVFSSYQVLLVFQFLIICLSKTRKIQLEIDDCLSKLGKFFQKRITIVQDIDVVSSIDALTVKFTTRYQLF